MIFRSAHFVSEKLLSVQSQGEVDVSWLVSTVSDASVRHDDQVFEHF